MHGGMGPALCREAGVWPGDGMRAQPRSRQSLGQNSSCRGTFWVWGANSGRHWGLELDQQQRVEGSVGLVGRSRPREQRQRSALYLETPEKVVEPPQPAQVGLGNRAEPAGEEDDRTLCPCLKPPTPILQSQQTGFRTGADMWYPWSGEGSRVGV